MMRLVKLLTICLCLFVAVPFASAADIIVTATNFSAIELRAAQWAMAKANENIPGDENGDPVHDEFTNPKDYAEWLLQQALASWIEAEAAEAAQNQGGTNVKDLWRDASAEQRAAAIQALQSE